MPVTQTTTETRYQYLERARRYAARKLRELRETEEWRYCHISHVVVRALSLTEERFTDLGTFGVECSSLQSTGDAIEYLNSGETYEATIVHFRGRFGVTSVGDIVEAYDL